MRFNTKTQTVTTAAATILTMLATSNSSLAQNTSLRLETVSNYQFVSGGSTINDTDANTEGQGFWSAMLGAGTGWTAGAWYSDSQVWDTDFHDPDRTANASDNDVYFDAPGTGISMFIGHGFCNDGIVRSCASSADCSLGSYCPGGRPPGTGLTRTCIKQKSRVLQTSSATNAHGNLVYYGQSFGLAATTNIALGEDLASGSWSGAGTNGGTNVAILVNSCGVRSKYMNSGTGNMFAGVHALMMTMPSNAVIQTGMPSPTVQYSDTAQWSARGSTLANLILANQNAAMADAWLAPTMVNNGFVAPIGIANDGAQLIIGRDATDAAAQFHVFSETWTQAQNEAYDSTGSGYWYYRYACNYDCLNLGI